MSDFDNLAEYQDPVLYDAENRGWEPEGPLFLALIRRLGGPVLELGCGTGRLTIPLAEQGINITGLDILPTMLERARCKAGSLPIRWVQADVRRFHLPQRFGLIFESGATFQHMLTREDQEALLGCVAEHLAPGGHFVVTALFPHADLLVTDETERDWYGYTDELGRDVWVTGTMHYDPLLQIKTETAYRRWVGPDGRQVESRSPLRLRYVFPQEMDLLLRCNDWQIIERYGDWDLSPLTDESRYLIYVCRRPHASWAR